MTGADADPWPACLDPKWHQTDVYEQIAMTGGMNVLSLFSGIGGLELGLERAGMTVIGQVEKDTYCRRILSLHWPEVPRHDDVNTCIGWWRSAVRPRVHVVAAGFPCQPFSRAGSQRGINDPRWLWPAVAGVVREVRPRWVVLENVPGLLTVNDGDAFGIILDDLAALRFDAEWAVLPAAAAGAAHRRDRLFLVAYTDDARPSHLSESETGSGIRCAGNGTDPAASRRGVSRILDGRGIDQVGRAAEPAVGRVAYGISDRVDRIRALGNAVYPAVAEYVGRAVIAADERGRVAA